ncbi:MAG: hypothetical protein NZ581_09310, partial [Candidatus Caldarchaeum sp.]|nr:hypothetical protein [Candidatus Caldarchaeum sp.]MDW8436369.1 hypothetical protein [Candidatus Caldarchaeum sp.]
SVDGPSLKNLSEHFRRNGAVLFTLIPLVEADNSLETALNEIEKLRVESLKHYWSYVLALKQRELLPQLMHLHKTLRTTA